MTKQAGFDLSAITVDNWQALLRSFNIGADPLKTEKGWEWRQNGDNVVVTANNPITGFYYHDNYGVDHCVKDFVGYVGIEGDAEFVKNFFKSFKKACEYYKDADSKRRQFI